MAIQILGIREYSKNGKNHKFDAFFEKNWRVDNVEQVLTNYQDIVEQIPENERYNIYFTVADCHQEKRKLKAQYVIPFDIDDLAGDITEVVRENALQAFLSACRALNLNPQNVGCIFSGNGVQFFIATTKVIYDEKYFNANREHYGAICTKIQDQLKKDGVSGSLDTSVFGPARLMRVPGTSNRKPNKPERMAEVLFKNMVPMDFDIAKVSGLTLLESGEKPVPDSIKSYPAPDTDAVLSECEFIKYLFANQDIVKEPQWYAGLSIVSRLKNGNELCHDMSRGHANYSIEETDRKIKQVGSKSGPRTCKNINTLWDGCHTCPHNNQITSPILIHGPNYIKTESTGFRQLTVTKTGEIKVGRVDIPDVVKKYYNTSKYSLIDYESKEFYGTQGSFINNGDDKAGTHYQQISDLELEFQLRQWIDNPTIQEVRECMQAIKMKNLVHLRKWQKSVTSSKLFLMNFANGVLDVHNKKLLSHSPEYYFTYVLDYQFDPNAKAPKWDKFMDEICEGDVKKRNMLEEFAGAALCNAPNLQTALILLGDGANGKSVFCDVVRAVVGEANSVALSTSDMVRPNARTLLIDKLLCTSDESSSKAFASPDVLKSMITGQPVSIKKLYKDEGTFVCTAKFIFNMNKMPSSDDNTDGLFRRLLIVPMTKKFGVSDRNLRLTEELIKEAPGICNRLIQAYQNLLKKDLKFDIPESTIEAREEYRKTLDNSTTVFLDDQVRVEPSDLGTPANDLYSAYQVWCDNNGYKHPVTSVKFGIEIRKKYGVRGTSLRINSKTYQVYKGIFLNNEPEY